MLFLAVYPEVLDYMFMYGNVHMMCLLCMTRLRGAILRSCSMREKSSRGSSAKVCLLENDNDIAQVVSLLVPYIFPRCCFPLSLREIT